MLKVLTLFLLLLFGKSSSTLPSESPPLGLKLIPKQTVVVGQSLSLKIQQNDTQFPSDEISYQVLRDDHTALPSWVHFNEPNLRITINPLSSREIGNYSFLIIRQGLNKTVHFFFQAEVIPLPVDQKKSQKETFLEIMEVFGFSALIGVVIGSSVICVMGSYEYCFGRKKRHKNLMKMWGAAHSPETT